MTTFPTPQTLQEATTLQHDLAARVDLTGNLANVRTLAALDASYKRGEALVAAAKTSRYEVFGRRRSGG